MIGLECVNDYTRDASSWQKSDTKTTSDQSAGGVSTGYYASLSVSSTYVNML